MEEPNVATVADAVAESLQASAEQRLAGNDESIQGQLINATHRGELPVTVARLAGRTDLASHDRALVDRLDLLLRELADSSQRASDRAADALNAAGITARPGALPSRMTHPLALVDLTWSSPLGGAAAGAEIEPLVEAIETLRQLGYRPVYSGADRQVAVQAAVHGRLEFVGAGNDTGRVQLRWDTGESEAPNDGRGDDQQDLGIFLRTPVGLIEPLLRLADLQAGKLLVDLGCGDGRVLVEAARRLGARAVGYETDPALVAAGRRRIADAGLDGSVTIIEGDAKTADLAEADVVFAFLPPEAVDELLVAALQRMKPGARFLSHEQLAGASERAPELTDLVLSEPDAAPEEAGVTVAKQWVVEAP
jgi:hypothetical protein